METGSQHDDEKLERLCRDIVGAAGASEDAVTAAANAPFLYQRLRARIDSESPGVPARPRSRMRFHLPFIASGFRWAMAGGAIALLLAFSVVGQRWLSSPITNESISAVSPSAGNSPAREIIAPENLNREAVTSRTLPDESTARTIKASYVRRAANRAETIAAVQTETEVVSDFLPLTYATSRSTEGSQIVRVEMPRSALLTLGLPISAELTGDRLKADVLVGEDGVALAIRFIQ